MGIIKRQGIKNIISGYLGILIGFVSILYIQPNLLTKEEFGLTRLLYAFSILVAVFVPLGIGNATVKYFPLFKQTEKRHHGFFGFMNIFPLVGYVLAFTVLWVFRDFILNQYRRESPLFIDYFNYVFPLIFFNSFIQVLTSYCGMNFKSNVPSYLNDVVVRVLTIGWVYIYFLRMISLDWFITGFVGIYGLQFLLLLVYIFTFEKPGFRIDWRIFREKKFMTMVAFGLLLWFASVASIGLKYFDSIMIGKFLPLAFVGVYAVGTLIPIVIDAPLGALEKIAGAKIAYAWSENNLTEIYKIYHKSTLYLFLAGGFIFLNVNVNIHTLLSLLPEGYQQVQTVVLIISIGTLFNMATGLNAPVLFNSPKYRFGAIFLISLAAIDLVLQMIFIPMYGINGAALGTCGAFLIYNAMMFFSVWYFFKLQPFDQKNLLVLLAIIICGVAGILFPHFMNPYLDIFVRTILISGLFTVLVYFLRIVPEFHHYLPWIRNQK